LFIRLLRLPGEKTAYIHAGLFQQMRERSYVIASSEFVSDGN